MNTALDNFGARSSFDTGSGEAVIYRLDALTRCGIGQVERLPFSIRVLLGKRAAQP